MKITLLLFSLLFTGCAELNYAREVIGRYGQQIADATLHDALWTACIGSSRGAVLRKFNIPEELDLFDDLCEIAQPVNVE